MNNDNIEALQAIPDLLVAVQLNRGYKANSTLPRAHQELQNHLLALTGGEEGTVNVIRPEPATPITGPAGKPNCYLPPFVF